MPPQFTMINFNPAHPPPEANTDTISTPPKPSSAINPNTNTTKTPPPERLYFRLLGRHTFSMPLHLPSRHDLSKRILRPTLRRLSTIPRPPRGAIPDLPPLTLFFLFYPVLASFLALVLTALCMSAGSNSQLVDLEPFDLYTFNTSRIGTPFFTTAVLPHINKTDNTTYYTAPTLYPNASSYDNTTAGHLLLDYGNGLRNTSHSMARYLGLYSFYSAHMQNYCEGTFTPEGSSHRTVSRCAPSHRLFHFQPESILTQQIAAGSSNISLAQLGWQGDRTAAGLQALAAYFRGAFVLFCFVLAALGLAFIGSIVKILDEGRTGFSLNYAWFAGAAAVFLVTASTLATVGAARAVRVLDVFGEGASVNARMGRSFVGAVWCATGLMVGAMAARLMEWIVERRRLRLSRAWATEVLGEDGDGHTAGLEHDVPTEVTWKEGERDDI